MASAFDKPGLCQRARPWLAGYDAPLALIVLALCALGLLTLYSAGYDHGSRFIDQARNMGLAALLLLALAQVPPQRLMVLAVPLYSLGLALLVAVALFGLTKKGARRWINVGVVIQPSEVFKIAMPLMLAWWFQRREGQLRARDFALAALLLAAPVGLIMRQPDLGTALLVLASGLAVLFFAGLGWKWVAPPLLLGLLGGLALVVFEPELCAQGVRWPLLHDYQQQRVCTLLDPARDPLGKGFHIIQGMIAIGSGGVWGKGYLQGTQTHLEFIPERTTDFIFASYAEELGLWGVALLLALELALILRALVIALQAPTLFTRLLAAALASMLFCYTFVNVGMVSGILPVVGVPLPFISYGGTAMATLGVAVGILMAVARARRLVQS